jgi:hypothetical protein
MTTDDLSASVRFDHQLLAVEREHRVYCMLELTAPKAPATLTTPCCEVAPASAPKSRGTA